MSCWTNRLLLALRRRFFPPRRDGRAVAVTKPRRLVAAARIRLVIASAMLVTSLAAIWGPVADANRLATVSAQGVPGAAPQFRMACPTISVCVVVDGAGHAVTSADPTGVAGAWTTTDIDGTTPLQGIACPSSALCVAVDDAGNVVSSRNPLAGASAWSVANVDGTTSLSDIACPSVSLCVAVGGRDVAVSTNPAGGQKAWTVFPNVDQTTGPECGKYGPNEGCTASLSSISCPTVSLCVGLDDWGQVISSTDPAGGTRAWTAGGPAGGAELTRLSCQPGGECIAACDVGFGLLGQNCPGPEYGAGAVASWRPTASPPTSQTFSTVSLTPLSRVWCSIASACFAADDTGGLWASTNPAASSPSWQDVLAGNSPVDDVSCPALLSCYAIDDAGDVLTTNPTSATAMAARAPDRVSASRARFHKTARLWSVVRHATGRPTGRSNPRAAFAWRYVLASGEQLRPGSRRAVERVAISRSVLAILDRGVATGRVRRTSQQVRSDGPHATLAGVSPAVGTGSLGFATLDGYANNAKWAYCTADTAPCPTGDLQGTFSFIGAYLPFHYARFVIPYDALWYYNGSGCAWSPSSAGAGLQAFYQLVWDVQAAEAVGMTPVVVFTHGSGNGAPAIPEPSYGGPTSRFPFAGWTTAGADYECGVEGIMAAMEAEGGTGGLHANPVVDWEAWNEPNGSPEYNGNAVACGTNPNPCGGIYNSGKSLCYNSFTNCGPLEAAELWVLADAVAKAVFPGDGFQVAAMTVSAAQNSAYEIGYVSQMRAMSSCNSGYDCPGLAPTIWAVHDYDDPSSGVPAAYGDITVFQQDLDTNWGSGQTIWITESAVNITSGTTSDYNCNIARSNCGPSLESNCPSTVNIPPGLNGKFGGCTDGVPAAQETGAYSFTGLASASSFGETITQVDWFEFEPANLSTGWDSGFYSANTGTYASPDGAYAQPRYSLCALDNLPLTYCSASTIDASDWSSQAYNR
jgi:hypothetical protein